MDLRIIVTGALPSTELQGRKCLFEKWYRRQISSQNLLPAGHKPDRHERVIPRRIRFTDRHVRDASLREPLCEGRERGLVWHREHNGVRIMGQVARTALPCCMRYHRGQKPDGKVTSDHNEVGQMVLGFQRSAEVTVGASRSCS